jgi:DNA polymerase-3 subunit delta'
VNAAEQTTLLDGAIPPQENTSLFGHGHAEEFLAESYRSGKGHHAVLIEGPEGIGKATLAFRFANHILAHPDPLSAPEILAAPDPHSPVSRQIAGGASHNLLHLSRPVDAKTGKLKTSITIDEVRKAGKFFAQTSGTGNWRIVVVDTADDLNRNAANAILKILEEPPKRSMFLVLSHAPGKLLPTIRSRCLPLRLRPLRDDDMLPALSNLGIALSPDGSEMILKVAGGSVAQALKLINHGGLEVISAFDAMLAATGAGQRKAIHKIADAVSQKDNEVLYAFFTDHIGEYVAALSRSSAVAGDTPRAYRLSTLYASITERLRVADAYNLERKQTVLSLLGELASIR